MRNRKISRTQITWEAVVSGLLVLFNYFVIIPLFQFQHAAYIPHAGYADGFDAYSYVVLNAALGFVMAISSIWQTDWIGGFWGIALTTIHGMLLALILAAGMEFWLEFWLDPTAGNWYFLILGLVIVLMIALACALVRIGAKSRVQTTSKEMESET